MNLKNKTILFAISFIIIPGFVFANNINNQGHLETIIKFDKIDKSNYLDKDWKFEKEFPEETKLKILELKNKLKNKEINRKEFHEELKKLIPDKRKYKFNDENFLKDTKIPNGNRNEFLNLK